MFVLTLRVVFVLIEGESCDCATLRVVFVLTQRVVFVLTLRELCLC